MNIRGQPGSSTRGLKGGKNIKRRRLIAEGQSNLFNLLLTETLFRPLSNSQRRESEEAQGENTKATKASISASSQPIKPSNPDR
ncbi:unnamed protein product [Linum trigynum]|uniref:Uncharacterized protein n=1 Tax=Linum trigynum TaxID=586398 RepID=A0AAV2CFK6_9ROSI